MNSRGIFRSSVLGFTLAAAGIAQAPAGLPRQVPVSSQALALRLNRDAFRAAVKVSDALRRQAEARADQLQAQAELDSLNQQIVKQMSQIRTAASAPEEAWDIDDNFQWVPRKKTK